jgi:23S rRNA pseudouridine1911/1915/1917 synthase
MDELQDLRGRPVTLHVGVGITERRLDKYLHGRFQNLSRHFLQDAIRSGGVTVNGKPAKPSLKLQHRDVIQMVIPEPPSKEIQPEDIPLDILYEDDDIIILNKQADLIVHPARGNKSGTLVNALVHYADHLSSGLGEFRPGIVHRLDRNTTGVMIVTKHEAAQWKIAKQFENRQTQKTYLAIVHGTPDLDADRIDAPLAVHPQIREKYAVRPEIGKEAVTYFEVLEAFRGFSFLKLSPKTGRTHQIRVHLSHIKHPIVADDMYGGKLVYPWQLADKEQAVEEPVIARCALHAFSIEFRHPTSNEMVKFEAPLPADMQHLLDLLRQYRTPSKCGA